MFDLTCHFDQRYFLRTDALTHTLVPLRMSSQSAFPAVLPSLWATALKISMTHLSFKWVTVFSREISNNRYLEQSRQAWSNMNVRFGEPFNYPSVGQFSEQWNPSLYAWSAGLFLYHISTPALVPTKVYIFLMHILFVWIYKCCNPTATTCHGFQCQSFDPERNKEASLPTNTAANKLHDQVHLPSDREHQVLNISSQV